MVLWLIYVPFALILSFICFVTNPLVVLRADEDGELRGIWKMWQTWDNAINPSDVTEHKQLPSIFLYDWQRHYKEIYDTTPELKKVGRKRWLTKCIDKNFSLWERVQRYICRVYWLSRNCGYGWAFWVLGVLPGINWKVVKNDGETIFVHEDKKLWWLCGAWKYKSTAPICKVGKYVIRREIFLGWKISENAQVETQGMIAVRATIRIKKEGN